MRRGLAVLLTLGVAAASVALVAPPAAAAAWLPEVTASGAVAEVREVEVAVDPAGNATAVWEADVGTGDELQTATRPVGAVDFGTVQPLRVGTTELVAVVGHADGATTVLAHTGIGLVASTRAGGAEEFPSFEPIEGSPTSLRGVVMAVDGRGAATVVWETVTATGAALVAATREPSSGDWTTPELVADEIPNIYVLRMVADDDGTVTVAWAQDGEEGGNEAVVTATRRPGGAFAIDVVSPGPGGVNDVTLASNAEGVTALAWSRLATLPDDKVLVAVRPAGTATFPGGEPVAGTGDIGNLLAVEVDSIGQVLLAWPDRTSAEMVVATRGVDGTLSPPAVAGAFTPDQEVSLQLFVDQDDALTLVWLQSTGVQSRFAASRRLLGGSFSPVVGFELAVDLDEPDVAADASGHVTVAYPFGNPTTENVRSRVLDASGPQLTVTGTASGPTAWLTAQVDKDAWSPATSDVAWDFGDGTAGTGTGTTTSHTYATSGSYTVRATASDASGNTTTATTTVSVIVPLVQLVPTVDRQAPGLSGVKVVPKVLPVRKAATLLVTSSESAGLKGVVERRRTDGRWRPVAKKVWSVEAGVNREKLYGKRAQQRLVPGHYRIRLRANDAAANVSTMTRVRFRVVA